MPRRILHDKYFKQAKAQGYAARSAYKLLEIHERAGLIRPGDRVLDLGCAPGSWLQAAAELAGPAGVVVGIDLQEVRANLGPNVRAAVGDIYELSADELLDLAAGAAEPGGGAPGAARLFDVVVSDMAPNTAGGPADHYLSERLCRRVLELLPGLLRPGGNLAMKVFEGELYPALLRDAGRLFRSAKGFKPKASRDVSREMYVIGKGYRGSDNGASRKGDGGER